MRGDPYFARRGPKSTGREYFDPAWLRGHLAAQPKLTPVDVQATLLALTVETVAAALEQSGASSIFLCGGGARNQTLVSGLARRQLPLARDGRRQLLVCSGSRDADTGEWLAVLSDGLRWRCGERVAAALLDGQIRLTRVAHRSLRS